MFMAHTPDWRILQRLSNLSLRWRVGGGGVVSHYLKKKSSLRGKILIVQFQKISLLLPSPIHKTVGIYWGWRVLLDQNFERNASSLIGISRGVGGLGKKNPLLGSMDIFWKYTLHRPWENNTYVFYVVKDLGRKNQVVRSASNYNGTCCCITCGWNLICNSFPVSWLGYSPWTLKN